MVGLLMPLKDRLKELRKAADLTQQALATKAGLSMSAIIHLEAGRIPDPRISTLRAIARVLGVTVDELIDDDQAEAEAEAEELAPEEKPTAKKKPKGK